jgi:hypothetical protein
MDEPGGRLSFLGRRLPRRFELRAIAVAPGSARPCRELDWRDALVVVERGEIEVVCLGGGCRRFQRGAILSLAQLPLRALRNPGDGDALLLAVTRRRTRRLARRRNGSSASG